MNDTVADREKQAATGLAEHRCPPGMQCAVDDTMYRLRIACNDCWDRWAEASNAGADAPKGDETGE